MHDENMRERRWSIFAADRILRGVFRGSKAISLLLDFLVGVSLSDGLIFRELSSSLHGLSLGWINFSGALLFSSWSLRHSLVFFLPLVASFWELQHTHIFSLEFGFFFHTLSLRWVLEMKVVPAPLLILFT